MAFENIKNASLISSDENAEIKVLIKQISEKFTIPVNELVVKLKPYLDFCKVWINPKLFSDDWTTGKLFVMLLDKMFQDKNYFDIFGKFHSNFFEDSIYGINKYTKLQSELFQKINSVTIVSTDEIMLFLRKELTEGGLRAERFSETTYSIASIIDKFVEKKQKANNKKEIKSKGFDLNFDVNTVYDFNTILYLLGVEDLESRNFYFKRYEYNKERTKLSDDVLNKYFSMFYFYCKMYCIMTFEDDKKLLQIFHKLYYTYINLYLTSKNNEFELYHNNLYNFIKNAITTSQETKIPVAKYFAPITKNMFTDDEIGFLYDVNVMDYLNKTIATINKKFSKETASLIKNQVATSTQTSTNSIIKIQGKPHYTFNEIIPFYRDYFNFICEFLNLNNIELTLNFKNTGSAGGYVKNWEFQEGKYIFHINNTDNHNIFDILEFIPHELVHVEQYHSNRLIHNKNGISTFDGINYKRSDNNFRNMRGYLMYIAQPWEREAHLKSFEIVNQYFTSERFQNILSNLDVELSNKINIGIERVTNKVNRKKNEYFKSDEDKKELNNNESILTPIETVLNDKRIKKIIEELGGENWIENYHANPKNYIEGYYYRVEGGGGAGYGGVGNGLYLGKDKKALIDFYDIENDNLPVTTFYGFPKWLDLVEYDKFVNFKEMLKSKGIDIVNSDKVKKIVTEMGYDGIRYYDATATGEEFVLFNTDSVKKIGTK